jgi:hypothetical protein
MKAAGIVTFGTDLDNPDFDGIARACGLYSQRVLAIWRTRYARRSSLRPSLVEVRTARYELSLPPKLTYGQIQPGNRAHRACRDQPAGARDRMSLDPPPPRGVSPGQSRPVALSTGGGERRPLCMTMAGQRADSVIAVDDNRPVDRKRRESE